MSLKTTAFNVEGSFHTLLSGHVATIKTELNAALGSNYALVYHAQQQPASFPSVRGWFNQPGQLIAARHRAGATVQVDIFAKSASADMSEARRQVLLIRDSLMDKLGFSTQRNGFYSYFDVKDYFSNPTTPATLSRCRLELARGWRELPDDQPLVIRQLADFRLIFV